MTNGENTCSKFKKSVSILNRAGAAVFAAPIICLVCIFPVTTMHNNSEFPLPYPGADRRKSQRDVFYLGRPIASIVRIPTKTMQKVPDPLLCLDFLLRPFSFV